MSKSHSFKIPDSTPLPRALSTPRVRDRRIDFLRGLALLGICANHTGVVIGIENPRIEASITRPGSLALPGAIAFLILVNYMNQMSWMVHHFEQKHFAGPLRLAERIRPV